MPGGEPSQAGGAICTAVSLCEEEGYEKLEIFSILSCHYCVGARRGPAQLRFRALFDDILAAAGELPDSRQQGKIAYSLCDSYLGAFALFFLQDPSVLEFQRRFQDQIQRNNLSTVFGVEEIPSDSQLRELLDTHEYAAVNEVFRPWFAKLQRSKKLERYQMLGGYYLVSLDGVRSHALWL